GSDAIFLPSLGKLDDCGNTWESITALENVEATVYDVAVHPVDANIILVGFSGGVRPANIVRKSIDGGNTWQTVLKDIGVRTFAHSARNPQIIYVSGRSATSTLFFAVSRDFGDSWERIKLKDETTGIWVNDMISVIQNGHEVLYFGTNKGVFSYTIEG